jgi:prophage maintenance system killer protein
MLTFLELNGYRIEASDPDLADGILSFSSGTTPQQLTPSVRDAMRPIA